MFGEVCHHHQQRRGPPISGTRTHNDSAHTTIHLVCVSAMSNGFDSRMENLSHRVCAIIEHITARVPGIKVMYR